MEKEYKIELTVSVGEIYNLLLKREVNKIWYRIFKMKSNRVYLEQIIDKHGFKLKEDIDRKTEEFEQKINEYKNNKQLMSPILNRNIKKNITEKEVYIARGKHLERMIFDKIKKESEVDLKEEFPCRKYRENYRIGGCIDLMASDRSIVYEVKARKDELKIFDKDESQLAFYVFMIDKCIKGYLVVYYNGEYLKKEYSREYCVKVVERKLIELDRIVEDKLDILKSKIKCRRFFEEIGLIERDSYKAKKRLNI